jgi:hypothetical protein
MFRIHMHMIRKLKSGEYRLYSRKKSESTGKRRNLGTFTTLEKARQHEREVQFFKKHWGNGTTDNFESVLALHGDTAYNYKVNWSGCAAPYVGLLTTCDGFPSREATNRSMPQLPCGNSLTP